MTCEAPIHSSECNGVGDTKDHFTPKALGKVLGWSHKKINDPENIQHLSKPCHKEKDRFTSAVIDQVRYQLRGRMINLGEHI